MSEDIDYFRCLADWTKVAAYQTVMDIVSRTSNRVFVGAPLCMFIIPLTKRRLLMFPKGHDPEYLALNVKFTVDASAGGRIVMKFPDFLKPYVLKNTPLFSADALFIVKARMSSFHKRPSIHGSYLEIY